MTNDNDPHHEDKRDSGSHAKRPDNNESQLEPVGAQVAPEPAYPIREALAELVRLQFQMTASAGGRTIDPAAPRLLEWQAAWSAAERALAQQPQGAQVAPALATARALDEARKSCDFDSILYRECGRAIIEIELLCAALAAEANEPMRLTLIGQVHELIDLGERYARRIAELDPDEARYAEGAVAYARKVTAPYNYNGGAATQAEPQEKQGEPAGWRPTCDVLLRRTGSGWPDFMAPQRVFTPADTLYEEPRAATQADPVPGMVLVPAVRDVLAERRRQIEVEGWTPEHDDEHRGGGMAFAAASYAVHAHAGPKLTISLWRWSGWAAKWFKPRDARSDLVRAGALILAEIERLDRAAATKAVKP